MSDQKLNIFKCLQALNTKDNNYYNKLSDNEKKSFIPFIIIRWLAGTSNKQQIYLLNSVVNPFVFTMGHQHKELLFNLLSVCTTGKNQRYTWNKLPSKSTYSTPLAMNVIAQYFSYSLKNAKEVLPLLTENDILQYASELGRQPDEITKIKNELKANG